jgi:hypothetical protein
MIFYASYKGTHAGWQGIVNRGIRGLDKSIYSHTEVAVGNPFKSEVMCVSSSGVDDGVRPKTMQLSPEKWDILPMPWVDAADVTHFLAEHKGQQYDFMGTGRFALPFLLREHPVKWFCTETAMAIAGYAEPWRFTPASGHSAVESRLKTDYKDIYRAFLAGEI